MSTCPGRWPVSCPCGERDVCWWLGAIHTFPTAGHIPGPRNGTRHSTGLTAVPHELWSCNPGCGS